MTTEAREELRRTLEGYMTDNIGAALDYLESPDADALLIEAGLVETGEETSRSDARRILRDLTGVSA